MHRGRGYSRHFLKTTRQAQSPSSTDNTSREISPATSGIFDCDASKLENLCKSGQISQNNSLFNSPSPEHQENCHENHQNHQNKIPSNDNQSHIEFSLPILATKLTWTYVWLNRSKVDGETPKNDESRKNERVLFTAASDSEAEGEIESESGRKTGITENSKNSENSENLVKSGKPENLVDSKNQENPENSENSKNSENHDNHENLGTLENSSPESSTNQKNTIPVPKLSSDPESPLKFKHSNILTPAPQIYQEDLPADKTQLLAKLKSIVERIQQESEIHKINSHHSVCFATYGGEQIRQKLHGAAATIGIKPLPPIFHTYFDLVKFYKLINPNCCETFAQMAERFCPTRGVFSWYCLDFKLF